MPSLLPSELRSDEIRAIVERFRPVVQSHEGDLEFDSVEGYRVRVHLTGACTSCSLATHTLVALRRRLMESPGSPILVVPAQPGR